MARSEIQERTSPLDATMTDVPDATLVTRISERLRTISANNLQGLAEDMAVICAPRRFQENALQRRGRNEEGQTSKGWPDAFVATGKNTVDGIEATREDFSWKKHLQEDLKKAADPKYPNLSGYFFVGGYPENAPSEKEIADLRLKFLAVGVPAANLQLMIGRHLALELAQPKYAQVRRRWLGLETTPTYFRPILDGDLFPHDPQGIRPSAQDVQEGRVYASSSVKEVLQAISTAKAALVRGHGACGKTTAAQLVACAPSVRPYPVYYVDIATLADGTTPGQLARDFQDFSGDGVLFIVDNIHLDEASVAALVISWKRYWKPINTRLLLIGRETRSEQGSPVLDLEPILMRAGAKEMRGIVHRHLSRRELAQPPISEAVMTTWIKTFGGSRKGRQVVPVDLLAFSSAVVRRAEQLARGDMRLTADDAMEAVREGYIEKIRDAGELENLLAVATLSEYEIAVPLRALPHPSKPLRQSISALGICFQLRTNSEQGISYLLAHAALGQLLLSAAEVSAADARERRLVIAGKLPFLGLRMARAGDRRPDRQELLDRVKTALANHSWVDSCTSLQQVLGTASNAKKLGLSSKEDLDASLGISQSFRDLVMDSRDLKNLCAVYGWFKKRGFVKAAMVLGDVSDRARRARHVEALLNADSEGVLGYARAFPNSADIFMGVPQAKWEDSRFRVANTYASTTAQLCRLLERLGVQRLATPVASSFLASRDANCLVRSDLGDISNIIRHAHASEAELGQFLGWLTSTGWFCEAVRSTNVGVLSGALMSLANHLPTGTRGLLLTQEMRDRIRSDVSDGAANEISFGRRMTLRGSSFALWSSDLEVPDSTAQQHLEPLLISLTQRAKGAGVGMYELQVWLGLMTLPAEGFTAQYGRDFLRRLERSAAPSGYAAALQSKLVDWLKGLVGVTI